MRPDTVTVATQSIELSDKYFLLIIAVMAFSGIVGGIANYFLTEKDQKSRATLLSYCVLGLVASFIVPLFLNMISSNLLDTVKSKPLNLFVFAGFCLLAAVFSRRFLENVYNKLLQQVDQIKDDVNKIEEASTEPEASEHKITSQAFTDEGISNEDIRVLRALSSGKFFFRSVSGLASDTQLAKPIVSERLSDLIQKGFVTQKTGKDGRPRWSLSAKGREMLGDTSSGKSPTANGG